MNSLVTFTQWNAPPAKDAKPSPLALPEQYVCMDANSVEAIASTGQPPITVIFVKGREKPWAVKESFDTVVSTIKTARQEAK